MTAMASLRPPVQDADALLTSYEAIRRDAMRPAGHFCSGHGLALFIRRGMAAWLTACAPLVQTREVHAHVADNKVPTNLRGEVASILAEMALCAGIQGVKT